MSCAAAVGLAGAVWRRRCQALRHCTLQICSIVEAMRALKVRCAGERRAGTGNLAPPPGINARTPGQTRQRGLHRWRLKPASGVSGPGSNREQPRRGGSAGRRLPSGHRNA